MTIAQPPVNVWTEPQLFPSGGIALSLEALVDLEERTVLFVCSSRDASAGRLLSLWSSSPQPIEDYDKAALRAVQEYRRVLNEITGPFPHR